MGFVRFEFDGHILRRAPPLRVAISNAHLMDPITLLGLAAATLTTAAFLPQVWTTWRTKSTGGLSLPMYAIFTTGVACWLVYGLIVWDVPIIMANAITFPCTVSVLVMAVRYRRRPPEPAPAASSRTASSHTAPSHTASSRAASPRT
jgi:MtN3 and saliva related transmembrane protein